MRSDDSDRESAAPEASDVMEPAPDASDAAAAEASASATAAEGPAVTDNGEEAGAMRDRYLRLAAEYDNYRKRTERERLEGRDRAQAQLLEKLLEPLDDLQRVAQYSVEGTTIEHLLEGVRMVERKLVRALEAAGLEVVDAEGQRFDPTMHEALLTAPTNQPEEDETVGQVFQPGYRFRGSLLRPARVQVRKHG